MSFVGRLADLDCSLRGAAAAGAVALSLLAGAAGAAGAAGPDGVTGAAAWVCWGGTAGALSVDGGGVWPIEGDEVWLLWFGGGAAGASASAATRGELVFEAVSAGLAGAGVPSVPGAAAVLSLPGAGEAGFCCASELTFSRPLVW
jgi:hypothetical protein